jgi:hypothetical protein
MKTIPLLSFLVVSTLLTGCGDKSSSSTTGGTNATSSGSLVTAPLDYINTAGKQERAMEGTIDTVGLNQAIQQFYAAEGRFPKDLDELVTKKYVNALPTPPHGKKLSYDADKGELKVVDE